MVYTFYVSRDYTGTGVENIVFYLLIIINNNTPVKWRDFIIKVFIFFSG